jgi:hypothetical protein
MSRTWAIVSIGFWLIVGGACIALPYASAEPAKTVKVWVSPVSATGNLASGYRIAGVVSGSCEGGSDVVAFGAASIVRCSTGHSLFDPCWQETPRNRLSSLCLQAPWFRNVVEIHEKASPSEGKGVASKDTRFPWGIELTDGKHCISDPGSPDRFHGSIVRYYCNSELRLLNWPNESNNEWQIRTVIWDATTKSYKNSTVVRIKTAWFAK